MKKFFALYMIPSATIAEWTKNTSPEEMKKSNDAWKSWVTTHKSIFADQGTPLGKTKRITKDGSSDVKNDITGYSIVEAESHEAASKLFDGHPILDIAGGYIELLEVTSMGGGM